MLLSDPHQQRGGGACFRNLLPATFARCCFGAQYLGDVLVDGGMSAPLAVFSTGSSAAFPLMSQDEQFWPNA